MSDGPLSEREPLDGIHPYIFTDPIRAMREALRVIEADRENLLAEVERLGKAVYDLQGPM